MSWGFISGGNPSLLCVWACPPEIANLSVWSLLFQNTAMADRFDCDNCKESLYGRKYIQSDDSPYCIPCYDSLFSNTCDECKELIGHDARVRATLTRSDTQLTGLEQDLLWRVFTLNPFPVQACLFYRHFYLTKICLLWFKKINISNFLSNTACLK